MVNKLIVHGKTAKEDVWHLHKCEILSTQFVPNMKSLVKSNKNIVRYNYILNIIAPHNLGNKVHYWIPNDKINMGFCDLDSGIGIIKMDLNKINSYVYLKFNDNAIYKVDIKPIEPFNGNVNNFDWAIFLVIFCIISLIIFNSPSIL